MSLPIFQSDSRAMSQLQTQWASEINPVLTNPLVQGRLLSGVTLAAGDNTINTLLSKKLQGWVIVGISAAASIYDKQASNSMADKTLILNASAPCTVALWVF